MVQYGQGKGKRKLTELEHSQESVAPAKKLKQINIVGTSVFRAKLKHKPKKSTTIDPYNLTEIESENLLTILLLVTVHGFIFIEFVNANNNNLGHSSLAVTYTLEEQINLSV